LIGLFNIRLGHWWWSGVDPGRRDGAKIYNPLRPWASISNWFSRRFSVQAHFLDELTARFHGPMRRNWYLSDGGHFENTGCYELLRRRIPMIVVIDDGADGEYRFEDFAQLVRKARLDFNATMREATADELKKLDSSLSEVFGTFDQLRGKRDGADTDSPGRRWNDAHAALVVVEYTEPAERSLIVWIKPTLTKLVPEDVLHYALEHTEFPQEPTGDQYFDEAQWESYRRLGQYIGELVFGATAAKPSGNGWHPRNLDPSLDGTT